VCKKDEVLGISIWRLAATVLLFLVACSRGLGQNYPPSCKAGDWFLLREQAEAGKASMLCKGVVDASLERRSIAEHELEEVIRQHPDIASVVAAHEALGNMYYREGRYRKALHQLDMELSVEPAAEDAKEVHSFFSVLSQYPDLEIVSNLPSEAQAETIEGNLFLPVSADGILGTYIVDTGANVSAICESEARRLRLISHETASKALDVSGSSIGMRVAEAPDLWIGKTHLRHVAFAVYPDSSEPFVELPKGHKGVLGISILIALGAFRIEKDNRFEILSNPKPTAMNLPIVFNGASAVAQIGLSGKSLSFIFDTGAARSYLYPPIIAAVPDLARSAKRQYQDVAGASGSSLQEVLIMPPVNLFLGKSVVLSPATVLVRVDTGDSKWAAGILGFDLISKVLPITVDFRRMHISTE
jgi:tetratricopeptide (TPR) repeat protein